MRWITGEPSAVIASISARVDEEIASGNAGVRESMVGVDHEDSYSALVRLESGVVANLRGSRIATGRKGSQFIEITGEEGSLLWNMEDLNHLRVFLEADARSGLAGYRNVIATELEHPFMKYWYAPGHIIGWDHTIIHQWISILAAITGFDSSVPTDFARFEDGARAAAIADALRTSAHEQRWTTVPAV
jgi:predicted dehydrogenase